jgi:thiamine-phosphate pyrophosphorylase
MQTKFELRGLYAITPEHSALPLTDQVEQALQGGARLIQYRDKSGDAPRRCAEAQALIQLCRRHGVPLVINDDLELAAAVGADGVHLGRDDPSLAAARERLGSGALIGVSCYNELRNAERAWALGADYLAFGRFFPSASKPGAVPASLDLLRQARTRFPLPLVAIGGIRPENGGPLLAAGADMLAAIEAVFGTGEVRGACQAFADLFATAIPDPGPQTHNNP